MFTRWPAPRARIRRSPSRVPCTTPITLTSSWRRVAASSSSRNGPRWRVPALLTSTSSGPTWASTQSRKPSNDSGSVTSSSWLTHPSSSAVAPAAAASRSPIATRAPSRARAAAVARPMPRAAPVTATTRPAMARGGRRAMRLGGLHRLGGLGLEPGLAVRGAVLVAGALPVVDVLEDLVALERAGHALLGPRRQHVGGLVDGPHLTGNEHVAAGQPHGVADGAGHVLGRHRLHAARLLEAGGQLGAHHHRHYDRALDAVVEVL